MAEQNLAAADDLTATATSTGFYHWSEGGDVFPLFALKALRVTVGQRRIPFLSAENLSRYGLIADPSGPQNTEGLPVGFTVGRAQDTGLVSLGFNCAACHTADIAYQTQAGRRSVRVDGAPGRFDFKRFVEDMAKGFQDSLGPDRSIWDRGEFAVRALSEARQISRKFEDFDGTADTAWTRFKMFWTVVSHAREARHGDIEAVINAFDLPYRRKRLMLARYYTIKASMLPAAAQPDTVSGPGRVDPFADGANYLFGADGHHGALQSPMRAQPLFNMKDKAWYDYTGNTNSILMRNTIQAMVVGGVTDVFGANPSYETSVNFPNLVSLEQSIYQIPVPQWPAELPNDTALATRRGRAIYLSKCASCHEPHRNDRGLYEVRVVPLAQVGTDPRVIQQWLERIPVPSGGSLSSGENGNTIFTAVTAKYCSDSHLSKADCLKLDDVYDASSNPSGRRSPARFNPDAAGYQAHALDGVWAFGHYLHNGSVPTVADLLEPVSKRPRSFAVGHNLYDANRLGYVVYPQLSQEALDEGATFVFDTRLPGNSNEGHEGSAYGTDLSPEDQRALLEYLKTHRSNK
ncbi:MAG: di-heme-cytochrome C peroxidase [Polyangiales bacterium]